MRFFALLLLASGGLLLPTFASAQSLDASAGGAPPPLTLDIQPQYPRPGASVSVAPESTTFDLSGATVTYYANGKAVASGTGTAPVAITLGGPGSVTTIKAIAVANGQSYTASGTLAPAEADLVMEPLAATHPFYAGGSLVAPQGQVRLIAFADLRSAGGKRLDPSTLVYNWKLNGQAITDASGIGRSVINMTAPVRYRDATIDVIVSSQDSSVVAEDYLSVTPTDPLVRVYENDPLLGIRYDQAVPDNYTLPDVEDTLVAVPYYFPAVPSFSWTVGGAPSGNDPTITLRSTGGSAGTTLVSVTASLDQLSEIATKDTNVTFGATTGTGIFGL